MIAMFFTEELPFPISHFHNLTSISNIS
jgi:hypothetical protein